MPLTCRIQGAQMPPFVSLLLLMGLHQLCIARLHNRSSSQPSAQECSAILQLASQSNFSTNCSCAQLASCDDGRCMTTQQQFVSCAAGGYAVSGLYLSNMSLKGNLTWLSNLKYIQHLDVSLNNFSGELPPAMWSLGKLTYVNLTHNNISGHIPNFNDSSRKYPLQVLDFSHNKVGGTFPQHLCSRFPRLAHLLLNSNTLNGSVDVSLCRRLEALDVSVNRLQGSPLEHLPPESSLKTLNLMHNLFNGSIPTLSGLPQLVNFDVSFNSFSGMFGSESYQFPSNLSKVNVSHNHLDVGLSTSMILRYGISSFWPNSVCKGCWLPSQSPLGSAPSPAPFMFRQQKSRASITARLDAILGIIVGCITAFILITVISCIVIQRRRQKRAWPLCPKRPVPPFKHVPEVGPFSFDSQSGTWVANVKDPSSVPVVIFEKPLMNLTFSDLLQATKSFDREFEVGDGTGLVYACVLPGVLEGDAMVTIEVVENGSSLSAEVACAAFTAMGEMKHDNLVPLLGYCIVGEEKLLIYKHMEGGSLEDALHVVLGGGQLSNASPLPTEDWSNIESWPDDRGGDLQSCVLDTSQLCMDWETRHKIALGVARALAYLHHGCRRPVVHGAVSSSCILLDGSLKEPMVANYGGAWGLRRRLTPGYVAPECKETAHMATSYSLKRGEGAPTSNGDAGGYMSKCDVYGLGVVLLELATGQRAVGNYGASSTLVAWVRALKKGKRVEEALEPRLPVATHASLLELIKLGLLCTADSPSKRPSMQQVVGLLKDLTTLSYV